MRNLSDRIAKLEMAGSGNGRARRIVRHVLDCSPSDRAARITLIGANDPGAFHVIRTIIDPPEIRAAA